jgi:hypothetical protein
MIAQSTSRYEAKARYDPNPRYDADAPDDAGGAPAASDGSSRYAALARAAAGIRVRRGGRVPVEQILLVAASVLFPLGIVFILLGWEGAAHNGHTYAQIDYLISGGILGLGLSVAGGFMYFGYWLSRQLGESRRQNALTVQALQRLEELLDATLSSRIASPQAPSTPAPSTPAPSTPAPSPRNSSTRNTSTRNSSPQNASPRNASAGKPSAHQAGADDPTGEVPAAVWLVATPRGSLLHRPECPVVAKRTDLRKVAAGTDGFGYCTMCDAAGVVAV